MKQQVQQPAPVSRTLQGKAKTSCQASVADVLQAYKKDIAQRQEVDEDELLQGKFETTQRDELEDDELLQGKFEAAQRDELDDDELLQGKFETTQRDELEDDELLQGKFETAQRQESPNNTGLPDNLKAGVEQLSGLDMSDVKVHYNSSKPASVQAYAYTQGTDIHVAPGQEKHLGHEAWHVAQQKQGRVQPNTTVGGMAVNDNAGLESEADVMGGKALQMKLVENKIRLGVKYVNRHNKVTSQLADINDERPHPRICKIDVTQRKQLNNASEVIQRAIVTAPGRVTTRAALNLAGGDENDMGVTTNPNGFTVPTFAINTVKRGAIYYSTLHLNQNADEGANISVYLSSGCYRTELLIANGLIQNFIAEPNNRRVYVEVDGAMADLSRLAELEHCNDFREAYRITLFAAQNAMEHVKEQKFGSDESPLASKNLAIDAANQLLPQTNGPAFSIEDNLGDLYLNKCQMSNTNRDGKGLHTFTLDRDNESRSIRSWISYFVSFIPGISCIVEPKDIRKIIRGAAFQVPGPASNEVIHY